MSKAVLVIDKPKQCKSCPCAYEWANRCNATNKAIIDFSKVQDWCPLKPMPQKKHLDESLDLENMKLEYLRFDGWNACLDEITGENNESNSNI